MPEFKFYEEMENFNNRVNEITSRVISIIGSLEEIDFNMAAHAGDLNIFLSKIRRVLIFKPFIQRYDNLLRSLDAYMSLWQKTYGEVYEVISLVKNHITAIQSVLLQINEKMSKVYTIQFRTQEEKLQFTESLRSSVEAAETLLDMITRFRRDLGFLLEKLETYTRQLKKHYELVFGGDYEARGIEKGELLKSRLRPRDVLQYPGMPNIILNSADEKYKIYEAEKVSPEEVEASIDEIEEIIKAIRETVEKIVPKIRQNLDKIKAKTGELVEITANWLEILGGNLNLKERISKIVKKQTR